MDICEEPVRPASVKITERQLVGLTREQVLSLSAHEKMFYLYSLQVKHKNLEVVARDLSRLLPPYNETNIIALIGGTGVGKTSLAKRMLRSLIEKQHGPDDAGPPSTVPFIFIPAPANGDKSLSWSTVYEKAMAQVCEVLPDKKHAVEHNNAMCTIRPKSYRTLAALREALESMLKHRKVKVLVIDEAVHLLRFGNHSPVMDTLKSLADGGGVKILLIGSYDLFDLVTDYGQVARRSEILHFERYFRDDPEDVREFNESVIAKLQARWPCAQVPTFQAVHEELMEASLGCVGLLKTILLHALWLQLENNGKWDSRYLAKAAKSVKLLDSIRAEIVSGERKVQGATYGESLFTGAMMDRLARKMEVVSAC